MTKSPSPQKNDLAATVLVEALYKGDEKAAANHGVSLRTLRRWRARLSTDPDLNGIFQMKRERFDAAWVDRLTVPMQAAMNWIADACQTMDQRQKSNPEMMRAVAEALKIMCEMRLTSDALGRSSGNGMNWPDTHGRDS